MDNLLNEAIDATTRASDFLGESLRSDSSRDFALIAQAQAMIVIAQQLMALNEKLAAVTAIVGEHDERSALRIFSYSSEA